MRLSECVCVKKEYFASRLRALMKREGMTQKELAADLGLTPSAISLYCRGKAYPECLTLIEMSMIFGVSTDYLLTGVPANERNDTLTRSEAIRLNDMEHDTYTREENLAASFKPIVVDAIISAVNCLAILNELPAVGTKKAVAEIQNRPASAR